MKKTKNFASPRTSRTLRTSCVSLFGKAILFSALCVCLPLAFASCGNANNPENSSESKVVPSDYALNNDFWDNASVYFVLTDRFYNGNSENDTAYGRKKGNPTLSDDCGKFFGGDIKGLSSKLDYLEALGINAIWISAPYEQIHGYCVGGSNEFEHYPYHGYYALDYTNLDANVGTVEEFRNFVDSAHKKGIRVVMDVVMNHPGYNTIEDAAHLYPGVLKSSFVYGTTEPTLSNYHSFINYTSHAWDSWWGGSWIRAGLCSHYKSGSGDLTGSAGGSLPDFITEGTKSVSLPTFLKTKHTDAMKSFYPSEGYSVVKFEEKENFTVRDYLVHWLSGWVREFGIDGFRCDTAKHVEKEAWYQLKVACVQALRDWKEANPTKVIEDSGDFWMTGEHFGHGVAKDSYFTEGGFNSMINFSYRSAVASALSDVSKIESVYSDYAQKINSDENFNVLSYISSHDTGSQDSKGLFYSDYADGDVLKMKTAGNLLAFAPGAIQIYYGDEAGRKNSSALWSGDKDQKTRSQMPWKNETDADGNNGYVSGLGYSFDSDIYSHWSKVLTFRKNHPAVGGGTHTKINLDSESSGYAFSRIRGNDKVVIVLGATSGETISVDVSSIGSSKVKDFCTGNTVEVSGGKATFAVGTEGVILIESAD